MKMTLTEQQTALFEFVKQSHGDQKRKYTFDPYYVHLEAVAEIVSEYTKEELAIEIALCHDLFEDAGVTWTELFDLCEKIGYSMKQSAHIADGVTDLTDVYTSEAFPHLNRTKRKALEAQRLGGIQALHQTVKYADMLHNTSSIVAFDRAFAKIYMEEKKMYLDLMKNGNEVLRKKCYEVYQESIKNFQNEKV